MNPAIIEKEICPISGLPILRKPEWTDVQFADEFSETIYIPDNDIICLHPEGHLYLSGMTQSIELMEKIANEAIPPDKQYIVIDVLSKIKSVSPSSRKQFIATLKNNKNPKWIKSDNSVSYSAPSPNY